MALTWGALVVGAIFLGLLLSLILFFLIWRGGTPGARALGDSLKIGMGFSAATLGGLFILGVYETWAR